MNYKNIGWFPGCFDKELIITSLYLTRLNKHMTLDLRAEERIVSHSQHETTVRPPDLTDG